LEFGEHRGIYGISFPSVYPEIIVPLFEPNDHFFRSAVFIALYNNRTIMSFQAFNIERNYLFSRVGIKHNEDGRLDLEKFRKVVITPIFPKLDKSGKIVYRNSQL
jgi:hypothetical protein